MTAHSSHHSPSLEQGRGRLVVAATPLGHLGDVTPRLRWYLQRAHLICAEDTRRARILLSALKIKAPPLWSFHAHNEIHKTPKVIDLLRRGASVVLLSDAGTPAVSDPGAHLVAAAHGAKVKVRLVPGPSAWACAISGSGFVSSKEGILFLGFLPRDPGAQREGVRRIFNHVGAVVLFESAQRIGHLLQQLASLAPMRQACLCREMTKRHEQFLRGTLQELAVGMAQQQVRGELTLVVGPDVVAEVNDEILSGPYGHLVDPAIARMLAKGMSTKMIASAISQVLHIPKSRVYQQVLVQQALLASS